MNTGSTISHHIANQIIEMVDSAIVSEQVAKQFVLEEIEAASHGNEMARYFAYDSGFSRDEYRDSMNRSWHEVDGPNGPQQLLLEAVFRVNSEYGMEASSSFRIRLVKEIMKQHNLGKYGEEGVCYEPH